MKIVKNSGAVVDFDAEKLRFSLLKSGAEEWRVEEILEEIKGQLFQNITTKQIYRVAFELLKKSPHAYAAKYNLRESIRLLGPAGFLFEKYVERLFASEGYKAATNFILEGACVSHEIDVMVERNGLVSMVECKFHQGRDTASDVKVPMYILSRFNDLKGRPYPIFDEQKDISECWIVTNNRFTSDAIAFANCYGLKLLSWDYPKDNNLKIRIDRKGLYPLTCLISLTNEEKDKLLNLDIILAKEIIDNTDCLKTIEVSSFRINKVMEEVVELCQ